MRHLVRLSQNERRGLGMWVSGRRLVACMENTHMFNQYHTPEELNSSKLDFLLKQVYCTKEQYTKVLVGRQS